MQKNQLRIVGIVVSQEMVAAKKRCLPAGTFSLNYSSYRFPMLTLKKYIAECLGTFALVFCGTGAIIINEVSAGAVTHVGIAITFGLIVMTMIYALGDISGAHLNPAVTIAFGFNAILIHKLLK